MRIFNKLLNNIYGIFVLNYSDKNILIDTYYTLVYLILHLLCPLKIILKFLILTYFLLLFILVRFQNIKTRM